MEVTYTNNWPHEPLVDNHPTAANLMWSLISIVFYGAKTHISIMEYWRWWVVHLWVEGVWREAPLRLAFWAMNIGLVLMIALSLLPIGLMQAWASIEHGLWYARSAEFLQQPVMENLRWLRTIGDTIFLLGVGSLAWFVTGLKTGWSYAKKVEDSEPFVAVTSNRVKVLPN